MLIYPREIKTHVCKNLYMNHHSNFTIFQNWKPKYPPKDEWINNFWYTHSMEYHSAITRNELLTHTAWMNHEDFRLIKRSQI